MILINFRNYIRTAIPFLSGAICPRILMKGMLIMKYTAIFTAASVAALIAGSSAFAQDGLTGVQSLNDRIDDITTAASDELNEQNDPNRFGLTAANAGWKGSLAASASATSGNTKKP